MKRNAEVFLSDWQQRAGRKPLVLRGARQVGKTYLVEHWGREHFRSVLTVDLERERDLHGLFANSDPKRLLEELALASQAAEPPKPELRADLDQRVGQPGAGSFWADAWRVDRQVRENPEAYFIPRSETHYALD